MYFCKCVLELNFATINAWKSQIVKIVEPYYTVKRPKFGIGPYVQHPLYELLKNHIFAWAEVSDLVQRGEKLYIFFCTNKKINIWGSPYTIYDLQQLGP
jgi:hypothetical protein